MYADIDAEVELSRKDKTCSAPRVHRCTTGYSDAFGMCRCLIIGLRTHYFKCYETAGYMGDLSIVPCTCEVGRKAQGMKV